MSCSRTQHNAYGEARTSLPQSKVEYSTRLCKCTLMCTRDKAIRQLLTTVYKVNKAVTDICIQSEQGSYWQLYKVNKAVTDNCIQSEQGTY